MTARAMAPAEAFLATLDSGQRAKANLAFTESTRTVWSNLPTGIAMQVGATERIGVKLGDAHARAGEGRPRDGRIRAEP